MIMPTTPAVETGLLARSFLTVELRSLNTFLGGPHWASKNKHWRATKELWMPLMRSNEGFGIPIDHGDQRRRVVIQRWIQKGGRLWDDENMAGGSVKCLCDALVRLDWLKDDCPKWRVLEVPQRKWQDLSETEFAWWTERGIRTVVEIWATDVKAKA